MIVELGNGQNVLFCADGTFQKFSGNLRLETLRNSWELV